MRAAPRRSSTRTVIRAVLFVAAGLLGAQGLWTTFWPVWKPAAGADAPAVVDQANRSGKVLLALDQAVLSVKEYVRTRDRSERDEFEARLRGYQAALDTLAADEDPGVRQVVTSLRKRTPMVAELGRFVVGEPDPGVNTVALTKVHQLVALRDEAVTTVNDLREIDLRRAAKAAESQGGTVNGLVGGGFATLGLGLAGAVGVARFMV